MSDLPKSRGFSMDIGAFGDGEVKEWIIPTPPEHALECSLCLKPVDETKKLVVGAKGSCCDACAILIADIMSEVNKMTTK